ncbi:IS481-like element ISMex2 family transposase [Methylorubrum extorquens]|uniref:IS481-like element ISMex2 family transposase n=1 Tax=Methylorubrum extorquens TaxID=408 RepID=UPI0005C23E50|nr:IS481-like element ISMex2 family transposase [Methylorubrum extorquens]MCP1540341.1 transposase InsO family protein [Methylorubrum extorquens]MCP1540992.1 transposase InsO family protein [Methylorubrum extorquens]MCP1541789.1 transposase InsO family protein [Methylorubrum extorquens]MCP1542147.1 transposase InsO family protein [Methylorubrum extorquens]MCP1542357.1 transposase InsO family protein [Methylorubrum extorquens]
MNIHQNARLTPSGRERLVRLARSGLAPQAVAERMGVCTKTVRKWVARFEAEGTAGLQDRSSRPRGLYRPTPAETQAAIVALRRQRLTGAQIARDLAVSPATVSRVLRRHGLSRIRDLEPPPPVQRYERERPGELIHIDIKKLGRFARTGHRITGDRTRQSSGRGIGWEFLHLAIDDHSRLAYSEILPDETRASCLAFLFNALRFFRRHGIGVERVMTDNGPAFKSKRYAKALRRLHIGHKRTRPYTPRTNGKVERFVQTSLREWAYARAYDTSEQRRAELPAFLFRYNWQRPHGGINGSTPISRIRLTEDNLLSIHS